MAPWPTRRAVLPLLLGAAGVLAAAPGRVRAQTQPDSDELVRDLTIKWTEIRIRDERLADDRESKLIATMVAQLAAVRRRDAQDLAAARAETARVQEQLTGVLAQIADRAAPGQFQSDSAKATQVVAAADPAQLALLQQYVNGEYVVYFPFDQYVVGPDEQGVAAEAASVAAPIHPSRVDIIGFSDGAPGDAAATQLAERRAKDLADTLVGLGIDPGAIAVDWQVETPPPGTEGIDSPFSRRATIEFVP